MSDGGLEPSAERVGSAPELPEAVKNLSAARPGDAVYVVGPDHSIVHWNAQMESLTGTLSEEALGKPCYEVLMGEGEGGQPFCAPGCSVMHLAQARRPVSSYEMRINTRWGVRRWVNVSDLTVESEEGPYLVHLLRDSQGAHDALQMARGLIQLSSKEEVPAPIRRSVPALTPRQLEVLRLLSEATVRNHVRSLLQGLDAHLQLEVLAQG